MDVLIEVLKEIDEVGRFDHEPWDWFEVEAEVEDWEDYGRLLHEDIPNMIVENCGKIDATASIYHLKDDVNMPEYVVLIDKDGEKYTLMLGITDDEYDDGSYRTYTIWIMDGLKGWIEVPVNYHQLY
jgi:hypothetical protein